MLNIKKISIVALVLLLIGVVGSLITFKTAFQAEPYQEEKTFSPAKIKHIEIESDNAPIEVLPTSDSEIVVELSGTRAKGRKSDFDTKVKGDTLSIKVDEAQVKLFNFTFRKYDLKLTVYLPEKVYDSLTVELDNGRVDVEDLQVTDIKAKTVNGKINMENLEATNVRVRSENGAVHLEQVEGEISGKVTNGKVSVVTDNLNQNMDIESVNGKIEIVTLAEPANVTIDAETVNGRVRLFGEKDHHLVVGNGEHRIQLKTVNGEISVRK